MTALHSINNIRQAEKTALKELPTGTLMQRAGKQAADFALQILAKTDNKDKPILVLAGPGNNGGDALEAACVLADTGLQIHVLLIADRKKKEPKEAAQARQNAIKRPIHWEDALSLQSTLTSIAQRDWSLVIDGMFGIGLKEALTGPRQQIVETVNSLHCPVLALDVPSGLNANVGHVVGGHTAIRATHTLTFLADKPGLHTGKGRDYAGQITVADLDINPSLFPQTTMHLNGPDVFQEYLVPRLHDSHKGTYGSLAILGGAEGMGGAPILAARAAMMCGVGRCYAVYLKNPPAYDTVAPEIMFRVAHLFDYKTDIAVIGPGLGTSAIAKEYLNQLLLSSLPLVLDADALNIIASDEELQQTVYDRKEPTVLTPHPLEAARLLACSTEEIQQDRVSAAQKLAQMYHAIAVLKGSGTVIALPDGTTVVNPTGNPGLATAGSGDVLSGVIGALMAQHWDAYKAACAGAWLHGKAAEILTEQIGGCVGITASEVARTVRVALNQLIK